MERRTGLVNLFDQTVGNLVSIDAGRLSFIRRDSNPVFDNAEQFGYNGGAAARTPGHVRRVGSLGGALQQAAYTGSMVRLAPRGPVRTGPFVGQDLETKL